MKRMSLIQGILIGIGQVLYYSWWFWLFLILWPLFWSTWLHWRQSMFVKKMEFVLLELNIPREVKTSPMAMEQVLVSIYALGNAPGDFTERWVDGEVTKPYSLEIASFGGEVHFYVRVIKQQKALIEAAFASYYPDVEMVEVEDYAERFPENTKEMYASGYDIWGTEMRLEKSEAYPIRSYVDFEAVDEEKQYDPIGVFIEVLGKARKEETVAIQMIIAPASYKWRDEFQEVVEKIRSRKEEGHKEGPSAKLGVEFPHILPVFPVEGEHGESSEGPPKPPTPRETDVLKAVEENLARPAFKTMIRYVYFSPKEYYQDNYPRRAILSALNQYRSLDLNGFLRNDAVTTKTKVWVFPHLFPKRRAESRKQRILHAYIERELPPETWMGKLIISNFYGWDHSEAFLFSTRSVATIFHPPTYRVITAPHIKRVESRKAGPPAGLAIYGDEEQLEKFK